ncbi:MAG: hypothetical protein ACMVO3_05280 [Thalassobaculum sp.]
MLRTHTSPGADPHHGERRSRRSASSCRAAPSGPTSDATHSPMFHQVEGLVIDKTTHMGHLKGCLTDFCRAFFERRRSAAAVPSQLFPVHRAVGGGRYRLLALRAAS